MSAGETPSGDDRPGRGDQGTAFRVRASCPGCGAQIELLSDERAARCTHCASVHLVVPRSAVPTFVIPDRTGSDREALEAFFAAEAGQRMLELSLPGGGTQTATGKAERWAARVRSGTRLLAHTFLYAPYWHLSGRFYEAVVGTRPEGSRAVAAAVRGVEFSHPAFADGLALPAMGKLSYVRHLAPYPAPRDRHAASREVLPVLPVAVPRERVDALAERCGRTELVRGMARLARDARLWAQDYNLVLRPFHLLDLEVRGEERHVLLDGHAGSTAAVLTADAAAQIRESVTGAAAPAIEAPFVFRPMRCPECAAALPLDRGGEVRFCGSCGKSLRLDGERLAPVSYRVEEAPEPAIHLPFWAFRFVLRDPRDGQEYRSPDAVAARLGGRRRDAAAPEEPLLVPAFRPEDRRRAFDVYQHLFAVGRPFAGQLRPGPWRAARAWVQPARFVSVSEREAAFIARHALLLAIPERDLLRAPAPRVRRLLFDAPLQVDSPELVLLAYRRGDVGPIV